MDHFHQRGGLFLTDGIYNGQKKHRQLHGFMEIIIPTNFTSMADYSLLIVLITTTRLAKSVKFCQSGGNCLIFLVYSFDSDRNEHQCDTRTSKIGIIAASLHITMDPCNSILSYNEKLHLLTLTDDNEWPL